MRSVRRVRSFAALGGLVAVALLHATSNVSHATAAAQPREGALCLSRDVGKRSGILVCTKQGNRTRWARPTVTTTKSVSSVPSSASPGTALSGAPFVIGIAVAESGGASSVIGRDQLLGAQIAETIENERGGVSGHPIRLVARDAGTTDVSAQEAVRSLLGEEAAVAVVGPTLASQLGGVVQLAEQQRALIMSPSSAATTRSEFVARVSVPLRANLEALVKFAKDKVVLGRVVLVSEDDVFSRFEASLFGDVLRANNVSVVAPPPFSSAEKEFTAWLAAVAADNPDAVVVVGNASSGTFVRRLREVGFRSTILGGTGLNVSPMFSECALGCDGLLLPLAYSAEVPSNGMNAIFRARFRSLHQREPSTAAAHGFAAVRVLVETGRAVVARTEAAPLPALGALRENLNRALLTGTFDTPFGTVRFDAQRSAVVDSLLVGQVRVTRGDSANSVNGRVIPVPVVASSPPS